ncbi:MAG: TetR/AcrR family transcriptional regulator [Flavobacteriaceae bacterium]|nr:TetR/AcrR family transcriptional regulator [Flavobacteriaceae bacterium]
MEQVISGGIPIYKESRSNKTKTKLIEKGLEEMWQNGYKDTSIKDIIESSNIPRGSFYYYFKSKEEFAIATIEYYSKKYMENFNIHLSDFSKSPLERIINTIEYKIGEHKNNIGKGCFFMKMNMNMSSDSEKIREIILNSRKSVKMLFSSVLKEALDAGEISNTNTETLTDFIFFALDGAVESYKTTQNTDTLESFKTVLFGQLLK